MRKQQATPARRAARHMAARAARAARPAPARRAAALCLAALPLWGCAPGNDARPSEPAQGTRAMVVTPHPEATRAGLAMLEAGGQAVDAAIAAAFALGVVQPQSMGIGGGCFLLVRLADGRAFALDARETAPAASTPDMFAPPAPRDASRRGGLAIGTPGLVAGLAQAQRDWGALPLDALLAPAIRLAEEGVPLGPYQWGIIRRIRTPELLERFPEASRIQFPPTAQGPDWVKRQPELARTLRAIAKDGPRAFYQGAAAAGMARTAQQHGGVLSQADLAAYRPVLREPLRGQWRGLQLLTFPPPSSGGVTLLEILNVVEDFDLHGDGAGSARTIHRLAEAMKLAFADRAVHLGDPDFAEIPAAQLISKKYAAQLRARIGERAALVEGPGFAAEDGGTAHLSVVDSAGNAVALTGTINGPFGSMVSVPGWGILLNNEMDDFVTDPEGANLYGLAGRRDSANLVAPGKRPLSSMAPTIVLENGAVRFVAGSNGGPRIITATLQSFLNHFAFQMDVLQAVSAPRFHHQWRPDRILLEAAHPAAVAADLRRRGHKVKLTPRIPTGVQAITRDPQTGRLHGAPDPRRDGLAEGL
ncbi:MAG: gamma-glutamyltransferase [Deltaproteobacteria bacterium]|nr:gamma-glutamyltransferase [Deltaproteobacteria bacterium]